MAEEVKHYGVWASTFSRRVDIALKLKGIQYKYFEEDLDNKSPDLIKYNPIYKKVPVLVHNGKPLAESLVIIEYIDETWKGHSILPQDPYERAQARFWARFIDEKAVPTLRAVFWNKTEREKALQEASEHLKFLEKELKHKFFGGETIGLVDIAADFIAHWVPAFQKLVGFEILTQDKYPKLTQWRHDFLTHDVVKEILPPQDKLMAYFKRLYESTN